MRANPPESAAAADDGSNRPIMFTRTRVISFFHAAVIITGYRQLTTTTKHIKIISNTHCMYTRGRVDGSPSFIQCAGCKKDITHFILL